MSVNDVVHLALAFLDQYGADIEVRKKKVCSAFRLAGMCGAISCPEVST